MKQVDRERLQEALEAQDNGTGVFTRKQIIEIATGLGIGFPAWLLNKPTFKVDRGVYNLAPMFQGSGLAVQTIPMAAPRVPLEVVETQLPAEVVQAKLKVDVADLIVPTPDCDVCVTVIPSVTVNF